MAACYHPTSLLSEDHFATYDDAWRSALSDVKDYAGGEGLQSVVGVVDRGELAGAIFETRGDLGPDHFEKRSKAQKVLRLVNRIQNLGFTVQIAPLAA